MSEAAWFLFGLIVALAIWRYAMFQEPKQRADGGPYPKVVLPNVTNDVTKTR